MGQPALELPIERIHWTVDDVRAVILANPVVIFCRGSEDHPRCGFSERVISVFAELGVPYSVIDVAGQAAIKAALREFSGDYRLPLVFANGQLLGGFPEIEALAASSELGTLVRALIRNHP